MKKVMCLMLLTAYVGWATAGITITKEDKTVLGIWNETTRTIKKATDETAEHVVRGNFFKDLLIAAGIVIGVQLYTNKDLKGSDKAATFTQKLTTGLLKRAMVYGSSWMLSGMITREETIANRTKHSPLTATTIRLALACALGRTAAKVCPTTKA